VTSLVLNLADEQGRRLFLTFPRRVVGCEMMECADWWCPPYLRADGWTLVRRESIQPVSDLPRLETSDEMEVRACVIPTPLPDPHAEAEYMRCTYVRDPKLQEWKEKQANLKQQQKLYAAHRAQHTLFEAKQRAEAQARQLEIQLDEAEKQIMLAQQRLLQYNSVTLAASPQPVAASDSSSRSAAVTTAVPGPAHAHAAARPHPTSTSSSSSSSSVDGMNSNIGASSSSSSSSSSCDVSEDVLAADMLLSFGLTATSTSTVRSSAASESVSVSDSASRNSARARRYARRSLRRNDQAQPGSR